MEGKRKYVRLEPITHKKIKRIALEKDSTIQKEVDVLLVKGINQIEIEGEKE